jgi:hypothetical protein
MLTTIDMTKRFNIFVENLRLVEVRRALLELVDHLNMLDPHNKRHHLLDMVQAIFLEELWLDKEDKELQV